jgi:hypothetical protein
MRSRVNAKRMVLDDQGVLHPYVRRFRVRVAAVVWVHHRVRRLAAAASTNSVPVVPLVPRGRHVPLPKISLAGAPSSMEMAAASWRGKGV